MQLFSSLIARWALVACAPLFVHCQAGGCGKGSSQTEASAPASTYRVRALVRAVEASKEKGKTGKHRYTVSLQHEAIPEFKDRDGKKVGMKTMTMPFSLRAASASMLPKVGDKVVVRFEARWTVEEPLRIVGWQALPKDTSLKL